ncbi:MAG: nitroreductase family protein [Bryobacterales bacterium]|jgi:nitroreductase|nr:nitroreductase family protein [Bryobacterales bacterium]
MRTPKSADTPVEILPVIRDRWSPRAFSAKLVTNDLLRKLLEAARWAASSYNEQPWRFLVATKQNPDEFERALSCLAPANQQWARHAPVLVLTVVKEAFSHNGSPNRCGDHDLGLAMGNLSAQATAEGLVLHQMAGILPERVRELYGVPDGFHPMTALAIGYQGDAEALPEGWMKDQELQKRTRKPLRELVFTGAWETPYFGD